MHTRTDTANSGGDLLADATIAALDIIVGWTDRLATYPPRSAEAIEAHTHIKRIASDHKGVCAMRAALRAA